MRLSSCFFLKESHKMKCCIFTCVEKNEDVDNFFDFCRTLSKTSGEYRFLVINCSNISLDQHIKKAGVENFNVINNVTNPGFITCLNQGLHLSIENFDRSIYINSKYSMITSGSWLNKIKKSIFDDGFSIGGHERKIRVTFSDKLNKLLYATNRSDPSWIMKYVDKFMVTSYIDGNIFVVNSKKMKKIGFLNKKYHTKDNFGIGLSFKFMEKSFKLTNIPCVYSSDRDSYRFDIGDKIKSGSDIVCPVTIGGIRKKILEM